MTLEVLRPGEEGTSLHAELPEQRQDVQPRSLWFSQAWMQQGVGSKWSSSSHAAVDKAV